MQVPQVKLHKGREQSLLRKHPWVFSRAIHSATDTLTDGDLVQVLDFKERILGVGHYQDSSLSIRMLAFEDIAVDDAFWKTKLNEAVAYRHSLGILQKNHTNAFRLVHGEGDQLPGLIIDVYDHTAVIQAHSIGMHKARTHIAKALTQLSGLTIDAVYCKSEDSLPSAYSKDIKDEWLIGDTQENLVIHEGGIQFGIDVVAGQKTGFFLDQRNNRELVKLLADGKSVLNCFCYTGGFSVYALQGGATEVISIDTSAGALEILEKNLTLNSHTGKHESVKENVLTYLTKSDEQYDIVIVDPPAFAKSLAKRHNAIQAYKRLNVMALSRLKKGGMLFTFSCSQVVDTQMFRDTIVAAAIESGRLARVAYELGQGPDHPVSIFHPEGHYLKGLVLYMD